MNVVMIAVHKTGNKIIGFRLLDTDTQQLKDVSYESLKSVLQNNTIEVENVKLEGDKIVGSNGALQRYPSIINGILYGKSPLIILFELPNNRYRVTNYLGEMVDIDEDEAVKYSLTEGIANGKVVSNDKGEYHISSISGVYKQDKLLLDKQSGEKLAVKMKLLGIRDYDLDSNQDAVVTNKDIEVLRLARGVLGIKPNGCRDLQKLKEVIFQETLERLGEYSFYGCKSLETIAIPEGVTVIPKKCFALCSNLKEVHLPNSLREIKEQAFYGCEKLKVIYTGAAPINIAFNAIPRGVRRVKRK